MEIKALHAMKMWNIQVRKGVSEHRVGELKIIFVMIRSSRVVLQESRRDSQFSHAVKISILLRKNSIFSV